MQKISSQIVLNFNTYPLYVGNESTTDFSNWDGHGASIDLVAEVSGNYSENDLIWTISDEEIASMTANSSDKSTVSVKARRTGYVTVTASLPNGTSQSCYITVIDNYNKFQMQRIVLNTDTLTLAKDTSAQLKAILYPKNVLANNPVKVDTSLTWESSDEEIAKVDENGKITAICKGTAKITVTSKDVGRTAVCTVSVLESVETTGITALTNEAVKMRVGETVSLGAKANGSSPVVWRSENTYIADVDENGNVRAYSNSNVQRVSDDGMEVSEEAGESYEYTKEITVSSPRLWNGLDDPYRYEVKLSVCEGESVKDELSVFTGFRYYRIPTPKVDANKNITGGGFYLNGRKYILHGANKHQDWGRGETALGYALTIKNHVWDAGIMYELGMNAVRLAHYQHSNEEIELYDRLGIAVWSEVGVVDEIISPSDSNYNKFMNITKAQMSELIKQQYNHPSIVVWGLGNEIRREMNSSLERTYGDNANSPDLATDYHMQMNELVKGLAPTRPTTYAAFCLFNRAKEWESDTAAMNLYPYWYINGMDKWYLNEKSTNGIMSADFMVLNNIGSPKPLGISEYGAGGETGFLRPYEADGTVTTGTKYPDEEWSTTFQAYLHEKVYNEIVNKLPWIWCSFAWQLFDSASDKKQGGLPGTNDKGLVAFDHLTKKDAFYFYKANWNDIEPFVHVVESDSTDIIRAYSNYDRLQLFIDGKPFGEPITDTNTADGVVDGLGVFMWYDVPAGEIIIKGYMNK